MNMNIEIINDQVKIVIDGRIDVVSSLDLKDAFLDVYNKGYNNVTIDFLNVVAIDSSGLGKILLFHKKFKDREGSISILNVKSDYIKNMFKMIKLDKLITIDYI